jgi:hypothetical protein
VARLTKINQRYSSSSIPRQEVIEKFLQQILHGAIIQHISVDDTFEVDHSTVLKACRLKDEMAQVMYAVCEKKFSMYFFCYVDCRPY